MNSSYLIKYYDDNLTNSISQQINPLIQNKISNQQKDQQISQFINAQSIELASTIPQSNFKPFTYQLISQNSIKQNEDCRAIAVNKDYSTLIATSYKQIKVFEFKQRMLTQQQILSLFKKNLSDYSFLRKFLQKLTTGLILQMSQYTGYKVLITQPFHFQIAQLRNLWIFDSSRTLKSLPNSWQDHLASLLFNVRPKDPRGITVSSISTVKGIEVEFFNMRTRAIADQPQFIQLDTNLRTENTTSKYTQKQQKLLEQKIKKNPWNDIRKRKFFNRKYYSQIIQDSIQGKLNLAGRFIKSLKIVFFLDWNLYFVLIQKCRNRKIFLVSLNSQALKFSQRGHKSGFDIRLSPQVNERMKLMQTL
ncbi:unnamed protein product [Paramecium octaurelia]|uniref:Uncharacterized protein n=1 Tax=Paramecium octaurelia TaxID=43137 RepID=A0A8S1YIL9_PAROT|nr:unnamed protein product [Paramecium octaurelia]